MAEVTGRIDGWWNYPPRNDSRRDFQSLGPPPCSGNHAVRKHCRAELRLDNAFVLIEGHPPAKNRLGERRYLLMAALRFLNTLAGSFDNIERLTGHLAFARFHVGLRHFHGRDARGGVHLQRKKRLANPTWSHRVDAQAARKLQRRGAGEGFNSGVDYADSHRAGNGPSAQEP